MKAKAKEEPPKTFEVAVLLEEDSTQTQPQLVEVLNVTQKVLTSLCTQWERLKRNVYQMIWRTVGESKSHQRTVSSQHRWRKNGYISRIPCGENHGQIEPNHFIDYKMELLQKEMLCYLLQTWNVNGTRYRQQMINLSHSFITKRLGHEKLILPHVPAYTTKMKKTLKNWMRICHLSCRILLFRTITCSVDGRGLTK